MTPSDRAILERLFPIALAPYTIRPGGNVGLVIVDPGRGFTREGNLADPEHMVPMVHRIAAEYRRLRAELGDRLHVLIFLDTHDRDIPEPPYPPHCVKGTGEEEIDPALEFLLHEPNVTVIRKDCINGLIGAFQRNMGVGLDGDSWENKYLNWVAQNDLQTLVFTGDCTDICVSDLVLTSLSARNHGMFQFLDVSDTDVDEDYRRNYIANITVMDLVVLTSACETFHAPTIGHDREASHHVGLWMMASRGAILASELIVD